MNQYGEILSLIQQYIEGETTLSLDEIRDRAYEYYEGDELSSSEYDHVTRLLDDL